MTKKKENLTKENTELIKNPYQEKKKRRKRKKKRKIAVREKKKEILIRLNIARVGAAVFILLIKKKI